jgi:hypothetical protein
MRLLRVIRSLFKREWCNQWSGASGGFVCWKLKHHFGNHRGSIGNCTFEWRGGA